MTTATTTWVPFAAPLPDDDRARRELQLLLAATDPLGLLAAGHQPDQYDSTASAALAVLSAGGGVDELFRLFLTAGTRVEAVDAFSRAALGWWHTDRSPRRPTAG